MPTMIRLLLAAWLILPGSRSSAADSNFGVATPQVGTLESKGEKFNVIALSGNGRWLAGLNDKKIFIWDMTTRELIKTFKTRGKSGWFHHLSISHDGKMVATSWQDRLYLYDTARGRRKTLWKGPGHIYYRKNVFTPKVVSAILNINFSPDGKLLFVERQDYGSGWEEGTKKARGRKTTQKNFGPESMVIDLDSGKVIKKTIRVDDQRGFRKILFSPDGRQVAYMPSGKSVSLADASKFPFGRKTYISYRDANAMAFSKDGTELAVAYPESKFVIYDTHSGEKKRTLKISTSYPPTFSPDKRLIFANGAIFDAYSGAKIRKFVNGNVIFLSDDRTMIVHPRYSKGVQIHELGEYVAKSVPSTSAPAPKPKAPAQLSASLVFAEPSGNMMLDALEKGEITVTVANAGPGKAFGVTVSLVPAKSVPGLDLPGPAGLGDIAPGKSKSRVFKIKAARSIASGPISLTLHTIEGNGFDAPEVVINFKSMDFAAPQLEIFEMVLGGSGVVKYSRINKLTVSVRNTGRGAAHSVKAEFRIGTKNIFPEGELVRNLGTMKPGEIKKITFGFFVNTRFKRKRLPVSLTVRESLRRYGVISESLDLKMGEAPSKRSVVSIVAVNDIRQAPVPRTADNVDVPPAFRAPVNQDAFAVVMGVERYRQKGIPTVEFAARDAQTVHAYLTRSMGFDPRNVILLQNDDVTKSDMEKYLGPWLKNRVGPKSKVFIYFAGHGAPDPRTGAGYLMPYEGDPSYNKVSAYPIKKLYKTLAKLPSKDIKVVLDACFSGQGSRSLIARGARPLVNVRKQGPKGKGNTVVLSAASGAQISTSYPEGKHGLLTYFLLKGLRGDADRDADGLITTSELFSYVGPAVEREARRQNIEQTPTLYPKNAQERGKDRAVWARIK